MGGPGAALPAEMQCRLHSPFGGDQVLEVCFPTDLLRGVRPPRLSNSLNTALYTL